MSIYLVWDTIKVYFGVALNLKKMLCLWFCFLNLENFLLLGCFLL